VPTGDPFRREEGRLGPRQGSDGGYQDERHVYAREGEGCTRCGATIKRIVLGQRSSAYCPKCQK
jgi:formamidopyrimidine-DNA glycosylase